MYMDPLLLLVIGVAVLLIVFFILLRLYFSWLHKVGPNQALIISHGNKVEVITGGTKWVNHLTTRWQELSLELMSFDVAPSQDLYTTQGVAVNVEAVTQIKV